jgi:hypothetical protein
VGGDPLVEGNFIGTDVSGGHALGNTNADITITVGATIGGSSDGARNVIAGGSSEGINSVRNCTIEGNYLGTNAAGTLGLGGYHGGAALDGVTNSTIENNVISTGSATGMRGLLGDLVVGNKIGTDPTGTLVVGNDIGINLSSSGPLGVNNTIGGTTSSVANVISGNAVGIFLGGTASGTIAQSNLIEGNDIGTGPLGNGSVPNTGDGIVLVDGTSNNTIGGTAPGAGNVIANNLGDGVGTETDVGASPGSGNAIRGNSIYGNTGFGISLNAGNPLFNTPGGPHIGWNALQNYPVLITAAAGATTTVTGTLNSTSNATFCLDFFANSAPGTLGYGQGQRYLGSYTTCPTDSSGNVSFKVSGLGASCVGEYITATATDPNGNTSQFSRALGTATRVALWWSRILTTAASARSARRSSTPTSAPHPASSPSIPATSQARKSSRSPRPAERSSWRRRVRRRRLKDLGRTG